MAETKGIDRRLVLLFGAAMLAVSLGARHTFGLFLQPMSGSLGWGRDVFAFAIALQNLVWGISQPFAGALADRFGAGRVGAAGAVLYVLGLAGMASSDTPLELSMSGGLLIGLGLSGTTFAVVFGAVSRAMPPEQRSMAMGVCSAVASFGQFAFLPATFSLIANAGWSTTLLALGGMAALMVPMAATALRETPASGTAPVSARESLSEALRHPGFWLLSFGFFVCGFQVVFIGTHVPAFLVDRGLPLAVGTTVLALIGLFNIAGTYLAGWWGSRARKPAILTGIYAGRAVAIALFLLAPITLGSAYAFAGVMGLLWLSTVPLTNGTVATVFGVRSLSMLGGVVFLFHQVGAFLGGWLGGVLYDRRGSYDLVWLIAIALSVVAVALNAPIREQPIARLRAEVIRA